MNAQPLIGPTKQQTIQLQSDSIAEQKSTKRGEHPFLARATHSDLVNGNAPPPIVQCTRRPVHTISSIVSRSWLSSPDLPVVIRVGSLAGAILKSQIIVHFPAIGTPLIDTSTRAMVAENVTTAGVSVAGDKVETTSCTGIAIPTSGHLIRVHIKANPPRQTSNQSKQFILSVVSFFLSLSYR